MTRQAKDKVVDFGFDPERSPYHFAVQIKGPEANVRIEERFAWPEPLGEVRAPLLKAVLDPYRWSRISGPARSEFNRRLHSEEMTTGRWKVKGDTLLAPHLGKELILLAWAVEDADPTLLPNMIANWLGLAPEERWWLYTTINATSGHPEHGRDRGWRKAIKIAFGENPADAPPSTLVELGHEGVRLPLPAEFPYERSSAPNGSSEHSLDDRPAGQGRAPKRRTRAQMPLLPEDRA
jgi:hypothetical protein